MYLPPLNTFMSVKCGHTIEFMPRVTSVLEIRASSMAEFQARARAATVASGPLSEVIDTSSTYL
jgi:hypothetical protein